MINSQFTNYLLEGHNLALAATFLTFGLMGVLGLIQGYSYIYKKHRNIPYTGIKFNTRNISYISMMIAVSVAITVVISLTLPITVFPPIRIAFEGIMIKITGMIFGPIVGVIVGLITETLAMMFVPSYVHIAYFLVAIGFGFWSGLSSYTFKLTGKKNRITLAIITVFIIAFTTFMYFVMADMKLLDPKFFGISISPAFYPYLFIIMMSITLLVIYTMFIVITLLKKSHWLDIMLPIVLICIITEVICTVLLSAWGDAGFFANSGDQNSPYLSMIVLRVAQVPIKVSFNVVVLTTVYSVLRPLIKNTK